MQPVTPPSAPATEGAVPAETAAAPLAPATEAAPEPVAAEAASPQPAPESQPEAAVIPPPLVSAEAPAAAPQPEVPPAPEAPAAPEETAPEVPSLASLAPPAAADSGAAPPDAPQEAPLPPPTEAPGEELAMAETAPPAPRLPEPAAPAPDADRPGAPLAPAAETAPATPDLPPPPPLTREEEALLRPGPDDAAAVPAVEPAPPAETVPPPAPGLDDTASGVITGRLPRIGDAPDATATEGADPGATAETPDPALDDTLPPLQRFARPFENPDGKPLFAILLEDRGGEVDRPALAALDLPLTIVIDPLAEGAAERAAQWRAGGQEVVMTLADLPDGATPGDLEQILQALSQRLPEAVAVIDPDGRGFQSDRRLSGQLVAILAGQGRGLVTLDQGLNAADQVARREDLAATTVFRRFDPDEAAGPGVKRYLDRAVFRAAQEGKVAVIGTLRPETVAGLLEWSVEGRASSVAIAPITALMTRSGG